MGINYSKTSLGRTHLLHDIVSGDERVAMQKKDKCVKNGLLCMKKVSTISMQDRLLLSAQDSFDCVVCSASSIRFGEEMYHFISSTLVIVLRNIL